MGCRGSADELVLPGIPSHVHIDPPARLVVEAARGPLQATADRVVVPHAPLRGILVVLLGPPRTKKTIFLDVIFSTTSAKLIAFRKVNENWPIRSRIRGF